MSVTQGVTGRPAVFHRGRRDLQASGARSDAADFSTGISGYAPRHFLPMSKTEQTLILIPSILSKTLVWQAECARKPL
jgi:hypothetical protein